MRYLQTLMVSLCFVACVQADNNDIQPIKQPQESYEIELFPIKGALRGVDVEIAGKTHRFIFDTGGGVNIISPEVARAIGCKPFGRITGFRMNGQRLDFPQCEGVELSLSNLSVITNSAVFEISSLLPADWPKIDGLISLKTDVHDHDGKKVQLVPKVDLLLSDLEPITVDLAVMDIIYDGNLGTSFLEQVILIVDLPHKKAWMKALPKAD